MIVIADDITGAAEIAGITFSTGRQVRLLCGGSAGCVTGGSIDCAKNAAYETIVIATDTRSMSEADAVAETRRIASTISHQPSAIFKKTDSALRGHIVPELTALMEITGYPRAVFLPANPSKGRIIRNGIYYIKEVKGQRSKVKGEGQEVRGEGQEVREVPIHETDFSFDPEFPAKTSVLKERFPDAEAKGIIMPDAETVDDIRRVVAQYNDGKTLFAGAADLFKEVLNTIGAIGTIGTIGTIDTIRKDNTLILCGSTQSKPLELGIPVAPMPQEVYDGGHDLSIWNTSAYGECHSLILRILPPEGRSVAHNPHIHRTSKEMAVHLRTMMAEMAKRLVAEHCPDHLIIEGGATAWATLQALGWTEFQIVRQIAPGVVQMSVTKTSPTQVYKPGKRVIVTLKPGSYPWGRLFEGFVKR
jgi:uncharacterized protein YgbK (DUF1537 family)